MAAVEAAGARSGLFAQQKSGDGRPQRVKVYRLFLKRDIGRPADAAVRF